MDQTELKSLEHINLKNTGHVNQCDISTLLLLEMWFMENGPSIPRTSKSMSEMYLLNTWLQIDFLKRKGIKNNQMADYNEIRRRIHKKRNIIEYLHWNTNHHK